MDRNECVTAAPVTGRIRREANYLHIGNECRKIDDLSSSYGQENILAMVDNLPTPPTVAERAFLARMLTGYMGWTQAQLLERLMARVTLKEEAHVAL